MVQAAEAAATITFLYGAKGGVSDSTQYSLEHTLALVEMMSSQDSEHCTLRDSAQERKLDAALKLTMPSLKKGSKKTHGEQQQTLEARTERENMAVPPPAAKRPRGEPTDRSAAAAAQHAKKKKKK